MQGGSNENDIPSFTIDVRSDTVSSLTTTMIDAMRNAKLGDDVYGEDTTVKELETKTAKILGKEAALFVPSGTMANLIATMIHCERRGSEAIVGDHSYVFLYEQASSASIGNTQLVTLKNNSDGTFDLKDLNKKLRMTPDVDEPYTSLIMIENSHNMCGGQVIPMEWINDLVTIAKHHNIKLHMDGARLFNASVASKVDPDVIVKNFDSVSVSISKGLGAPIGSLLVGSSEFITKACRLRKALGGGIHQVGVIAAPGLVALDEMVERLANDHKNAYTVAKAVSDSCSKFIGVDVNRVNTNIVILQMLQPKLWNAQEMIVRMKTTTEEEKRQIGNIIIKSGTRGNDNDWVRLTFYRDITEQHVNMIIQKLLYVIEELGKLKIDKC